MTNSKLVCNFSSDITNNCDVWRYGSGTNQRRSDGRVFWSKPSVKVVIKTAWNVVSICEVLWSSRLNTSKVTGNRQEDRSSQWEATKRSVRLSTARWSARTEIDINDGERRLFDISSESTSGLWYWTAQIETVVDIATPCWRLKSSEDRKLRSWEHSAACIRLLAKLSLVTFSVTYKLQPIDCNVV